MVTRHRQWRTERKGHHVISVQRHPDQKPARPASEVVREPLQRRGGYPSTPAAQTLNGVVAPFQAPTRLLRQLLVHEQDRRVRGSSRSAVFPSRSCYSSSETRRLQPLLAFGLWVSLRHPIFTTGSMSSWLADAAKETTALSVLFSFQHFVCSTTHFIASPRSPGIGRLPGTVKHLAVSPCPLGMGLRSGLTVFFFEEEIEAFVFLFLQRSTSSTGPVAVLFGVHPRTGWTFCPTCPRTPRSFKAPDPSGCRGGNGRPLLPSFVRHSLCSRADRTALDR